MVVVAEVDIVVVQVRLELPVRLLAVDTFVAAVRTVAGTFLMGA